MINIGTRFPIPKDWKINAYDHFVQSKRVSMWGTRMLLCSCGVSLRNGSYQQMYTAHYQQEVQARQFLKEMHRRYA